MATINTSYVRRQLCAIAQSSKAIRRLLYQTLEKIEEAPSSFAALDIVPPTIRAKYPNVTLRKAKIQSGRHNYRLVFAHWKLAQQEDHVDVLYAFRRKDGYPIDWDWVDGTLGS